MGFTITQGFRLGVSAYRGAYLDRDFEYYFPGEADPHARPGTAYAIEGQWARGPSNAYGELQKFQFTYRAIPTFNEYTGCAELRRVLSPRWYAAARVSYLRSNATPALQVYEASLGFRPNRYQLLKLGYEVQQGPAIRGATANVLAFQCVSSLPSFSIAR